MYRQQPYGWGDAIGQILGAVMQRNKERGERKDFVNMLGDASKFGTDTLGNLDVGGQTHMQDLASRENGGNYMNKTGEDKIRQGLLPARFQTPTLQSPDSNMLGQGLLGQPQQQQPMSIEQAIAPAQKAMAQYSPENNPVNITTSAPKTLAQQTSMIKSQIGPAMKELMAKNKGYDPRQLYTMLQQATNDKIAEHTATYNQDESDKLLTRYQSSKNPQEKTWLAAIAKQKYKIDLVEAAKQYEVSAGDRFKEDNTNARWLTPSGNNTQNNETELYKWGTPSANNTQTTQASMYSADSRANSSRYATDNRRTNTTNGKSNGTAKALSPDKVGQYSNRYTEIMSDIYDSSKDVDRKEKINNYMLELNALGEALDLDVENDLDYITKTNPKGV